MNQKQLENQIKSLKTSIKINRDVFDSDKKKFIQYAQKRVESGEWRVES